MRFEEPKNYQINCSRCDFSINYLRKKRSAVENAMKKFMELPDSSEAPCQHILQITELS